jgi:hypothetical protein
MSATVARTAQWVEREYGDEKWPAVMATIHAEIAAEPAAADLGRVHARVVRSQYGPDALECLPATFDGHEARVPRGVSVGAVAQLLRDAVLDRCTSGTNLVVELGSGWGWHVIAAWLGGGPRDALYVGAEYTEAGRRCAHLLASLEPSLRFRSLPFDYNEPDLSAVAGAREAVVFTGHSIEQIPYVKPALFEAILSLAPRVTCVHLEPVGWQLEGAEAACSSRVYAERHDYSRNLVEQLRLQEAAGRIELEAVLPNVVGVNARNATTLIAWRSAR